MKKFPYIFSIKIKCIFALGFVVAGVVIALNIYRFCKIASPSTYNIITLICTVLVATLAIVIGISMLIASYFKIDDKFLTLRWGILRNKIEISAIKKIIVLEKAHKLTVHFNDDNYMIVYIGMEKYDDFSQFLLTKNKDIIIEFNLE